MSTPLRPKTSFARHMPSKIWVLQYAATLQMLIQFCLHICLHSPKPAYTYGQKPKSQNTAHNLLVESVTVLDYLTEYVDLKCTQDDWIAILNQPYWHWIKWKKHVCSGFSPYHLLQSNNLVQLLKAPNQSLDLRLLHQSNLKESLLRNTCFSHLQNIMQKKLSVEKTWRLSWTPDLVMPHFELEVVPKLLRAILCSPARWIEARNIFDWQ